MSKFVKLQSSCDPPVTYYLRKTAINGVHQYSAGFKNSLAIYTSYDSYPFEAREPIEWVLEQLESDD